MSSPQQWAERIEDWMEFLFAVLLMLLMIVACVGLIVGVVWLIVDGVT